jgi:hypothetical protein
VRFYLLNYNFDHPFGLATFNLTTRKGWSNATTGSQAGHKGYHASVATVRGAPVELHALG